MTMDRKCCIMELEAVLLLQLYGVEDDYRMAALYNNMSGIYRGKGDLDTAATYIHKAVLILQNLSESDAEIAISYSNLAGLYVRLKDMTNAEKYAKEAVGIFRTKVGTQDVHYSAALCTLGEVHFAKGEYTEAEELFNEALQLIARDYGTGTDSYKIVEKNIKLCQEKK